MSTRHLDDIIQNAGFALVRDGKHRIYRHIELNKTLVTASTPSDQRAESNIIAQVARLTGRKERDLLGGKRKPKSTKPSSVVPDSPEPASIAETTATDPPQLTVEECNTVPDPLTASERRYLRRLEKHETQRKEKGAKQQRKYQHWIAMVHAHVLELVKDLGEAPGKDEIAEEYETAALALYIIARKTGHNDAELMVADCKTDGCNSTLFVVRIGRCYLDLFSAMVHESPRWTVDVGESVAQIEVWGSLRVDKAGDGYVISDSDI